jgi:hypothetical protein
MIKNVLDREVRHHRASKLAEHIGEFVDQHDGTQMTQGRSTSLATRTSARNRGGAPQPAPAIRGDAAQVDRKQMPLKAGRMTARLTQRSSSLKNKGRPRETLGDALLVSIIRIVYRRDSADCLTEH